MGIGALTGKGRMDGSAPQFSPDGKSIVFLRKTNSLWIKDMETQKERLLVTQGELVDSASWSPDGKSVAFVSTKSAGKARMRSIWVIGADGKNPRQLGTPGSPEEGKPEWDFESAYVSWMRGEKIWESAADGSGAKEAADQENLMGGTWHPSGKAAFMQDGMITVVGGDGPTISLNQSGMLGKWSPDGTWLYFRSDDGALMRVNPAKPKAVETVLKKACFEDWCTWDISFPLALFVFSDSHNGPIETKEIPKKFLAPTTKGGK